MSEWEELNEGAWRKGLSVADENKLMCPECGARYVRHEGTSTTLVGYGHGPCGRKHDDNCLKRIYVCERGHETELSVIRKCECGWRGKMSCFCRAGDKIEEWPQL